MEHRPAAPPEPEHLGLDVGRAPSLAAPDRLRRTPGRRPGRAAGAAGVPPAHDPQRCRPGRAAGRGFGSAGARIRASAILAGRAVRAEPVTARRRSTTAGAGTPSTRRAAGGAAAPAGSRRARARASARTAVRVAARPAAACGARAVVAPYATSPRRCRARATWPPVSSTTFSPTIVSGTTGPGTTGPRTTGPRTTGPRTTGPRTTGLRATRLRATRSGARRGAPVAARRPASAGAFTGRARRPSASSVPRCATRAANPRPVRRHRCGADRRRCAWRRRPASGLLAANPAAAKGVVPAGSSRGGARRRRACGVDRVVPRRPRLRPCRERTGRTDGSARPGTPNSFRTGQARGS